MSASEDTSMDVEEPADASQQEEEAADEPGVVQSAMETCFSSGPDPEMGPFISRRFVRCINGEGRWLLSGAKPGNGIECLLDSSLETWWQSDGKSPHIAQVTFPTRTTVIGVAVCMIYSVDESYTPSKINVLAGSCRDGTVRVSSVQLEEPDGWVYIPLALADTDADLTVSKACRSDPASRVGTVGPRGEVCCLPWTLKPLRCHVLQIQVPAMHQNGRDTRIRQVRVFGPAMSHKLTLPPAVPAGGEADATVPAAAAALDADPELAARIKAMAEASAAAASSSSSAASSSSRKAPQLQPGAVAFSSMMVR